MKKIITEELLNQYKEYLFEDEKRPSTIKKYINDIKKLQEFAGGREISKKLMISYKSFLVERGRYKERSANSFLVAANGFLRYVGWEEAIVKLYQIQNEVFCPRSRYLTKNEYKQLISMARELGKGRLVMILQTICATGMRVSELEYVTVQSVKQGYLEIRNKGKSRKVLLSNKLRVSLKRYMRQNSISEGAIFITSRGNVLNRSNIWREMKLVGEKAGIDKEKVFPHNLRHLFAQCFYKLDKDLAKLADILGHSSINTTRIYIKSTGEEHLKQLEKMKLVFI